MKTNAISRIIIWSIVLVLLIGLLGVGLYRPGRRLASDTPAETAVPVRLNETPAVSVDEEPESSLEATVTATAVNIRSAPNSDSQAVGVLEQNDTVIITRQETVNGEAWSFITYPSSGWVKAEYLRMETKPSSFSSEGISLDPRQIREIEIEWASGNISIQPADVDTIQVSESEPAEPKYAMVWKQSGDKLTIRFSENNRLDFGFGISINDVISKDLTILVPKGWECDSLEIAAASATVDVKNMVIGEVDFDGASGTCDFENCVIEELDLDTASGDVHFTGSLGSLDCDAASASVIAVFDNAPSRIDMDSLSGDLDITLHEGVGFTVTMDGLSTDFVSDFGYSQKRDGNYYRGDGACKITLDAMSGDLYIREYKEADAEPVVPTDPTASGTHHHTDACTTDPDSCPDNAAHHTEPHHN